MTTDASDAEDDRLLETGDLGRLFARHYDDLVTVARLRVGPDRAHDLVHGALLRTLGEIRRGHHHPVPFRVVVHQHLRWAVGALKGEARPAGLPDGWDPEDPAAYDAFDHLEGRLTVEGVLAGLPERDRDVMRRRFIDGRAPAEIADDLGMTRNAVDQALWRGRKAVRRTWLDE